MYDLAEPNAKPGTCVKCKGTGTYHWGGTVNGKSRHSGKCNSCGGTGNQTGSDIGRNRAYNRHKIARMMAHETSRGDPVDLAYEDQCSDACGPGL